MRKGGVYVSRQRRQRRTRKCVYIIIFNYLIIYLHPRVSIAVSDCGGRAASPRDERYQALPSCFHSRHFIEPSRDTGLCMRERHFYALTYISGRGEAGEVEEGGWGGGGEGRRIAYIPVYPIDTGGWTNLLRRNIGFISFRSIKARRGREVIYTCISVEGGLSSLPFITLSRIIKYLAFHIFGSFPYRINGRPTGLIDR